MYRGRGTCDDLELFGLKGKSTKARDIPSTRANRLSRQGALCCLCPCCFHSPLFIPFFLELLKLVSMVRRDEEVVGMGRCLGLKT